MTLTKFTRLLNEYLKQHGGRELTRAAVEYRINAMIESGDLVESEVRTERDTGTFEWSLDESLIVPVASYRRKKHKKTAYFLRTRLSDDQEWSEPQQFDNRRERDRAAATARVLLGFRVWTYEEKQ